MKNENEQNAVTVKQKLKNWLRGCVNVLCITFFCIAVISAFFRDIFAPLAMILGTLLKFLGNMLVNFSLLIDNLSKQEF